LKELLTETGMSAIKLHVASSMQRDKGFALVVVIVILLLVTFLASQLILQVRTELKVAHNVKQRGTGVFLAEAGINLGLFRIMDKPLYYDNEEYENFQEGYPYETSLPNGKILYYVVNESGKIDLNNLPPRLLELFLEYYNVEPDRIAIIMDSLQDWRDQDNLHRLHGAEKDTYEELLPPYTPRNGNITEPDEFFLVNGTDILLDKFGADEIFTVHNNTKKINFNSLTPGMLDFLTAGDPEKKQAYHEAQKMYITLSGIHALEILGDERYALLKPFLSFSSNNNRYYFIVSEGRKVYDLINSEETNNKDEAGIKISILAEVTNKKYTYLSWKEDNI
jgi:general secretion pathway protein K